MFKKLLIFSSIAISFLAFIWYFFFSLKEEPKTEESIVSKYRYTKDESVELNFKSTGVGSFKFSYRSFDGAIVNGQMSFPESFNRDESIESKYPVLIGMHAMGRSYPRWWLDGIDGRPTVTHVNHIAESANRNGYIVIAIDARNHGSRKDPGRGLRSIMTDLYFWGDKKDYESMVYKSVLDYRVLLDWIETQQEFDKEKISVAGYSMGGQMSLLLAGVDERVDSVISIVPPHLDDKVALVAPKNLAHRITDASVLLITGDEDENASSEENLSLFRAIASKQKKHLTFKAGHLLPESYVSDVEQWLATNPLN